MIEPNSTRRQRGFQTAASLVQSEIRAGGEARGFAVARVLTHWAAIVGPELANLAQPVRVSYPPSGFGATLTVLVQGASAPLVAMQEQAIRAKVNACYGYNAISRIRFTQTSAHGFAEAQAAFRPQAAPEARPSPAARSEAQRLTEGVGDAELRHALAGLGETILSRSERKE